MLLEVDTLSVRFGGIHAVEEASLQVESGQTVGVIGPNGAGKTTLLNAVNRLVPAAGIVHFRGERIDRARTHRLRAAGLTRSFQHPQLEHRLTVGANIAGGLTFRRNYGWLGAGLTLPRMRRREAQIMAEVREIGDLFGIGQWIERMPEDAPHGILKIADVARACLGSPVLALLDEPFAALTREEKDSLTGALRELTTRQRDRLSILLIDHDVDLVARSCDRLYAMNLGRVIAAGASEAVITHPAVVDSYLG